ncbi:mitochondrial RNA pseudouridine synthase RPUSD4 [Trichonephila clavata]|uniref:Pseudouridylate synthase RPUSD4, mitochondrial n=1 Tax=Trichonephila clavata TaxID=2740835 RepID=A0A8X6F7K6_TRICU|nr:mitochondrial RNA pseudouridine synthase RPUSD4 [Trichonephila clavata]
MFLCSKNSLNRIPRVLNFRNFHLTFFASSKREITEYNRCENDTTVSSKLSMDQPRQVSNDFFGVESDEGVIEVENKPTLDNSGKKRVLIDTKKEKTIIMRFGTIRYDAHNKPNINSRVEISGAQQIFDTEEDKMLTSSKRLFSINSVEKVETLSKLGESSVSLNEKIKPESSSSSYIDDLYFHDKYVEKDCIDYNSEHSSSVPTDDKSNFIDEFYFSNNTTEENISTEVKTEIMIEEPSTPAEKNSSAFISDIEKNSFFDEICFSHNSTRNNSKTGNEKNLGSIGINCKTLGKDVEEFGNQESNSELSEKDKVSLFDENYFGKDLSNDANLIIDKNLVEYARLESGSLPEQSSIKIRNLAVGNFESNEFSSVIAKKVPEMKNNFVFKNSEFLNADFQKNSKNSKKMKLEITQNNLKDHLEENKNYIDEENAKLNKSMHSQNLKIQKEINENEGSETAYDYVKKLRSARKQSNPELVKGKFIPMTEKLDSKGFRILENQVPSLIHYTRDEIIDLLVKNVLYSDDDLIVLNKPYNLVIHDSKTVKGASLSQYLDDLASELDRQTNKPKLFTVHRLDKETTGCLLLARNETSAHMLKSLFAQRKIIKTYWIVTIKVPDPLEGVIDIPISEGSVNDKARMVLHPDLPKDMPYKNHSAHGKRAVTHYKVIAQSGNAALVEVKPETGLKHQIRVHFGFGLSCPILGDHKYSYLDKLVPQKLQADLLQRLHVRQSKVRYIPMHIYARSVLIPQYKGGRNLFVMAPMPIHMSKNLQKLKFRKNN